jgi:hypothetical protein
VLFVAAGNRHSAVVLYAGGVVFDAVILLTLPVGIPMWILTALSSEREPGRDA